MLEKVKSWAHRLKLDVVAIYLAGRDPRTPWYAKAIALAVAAYAFSPIDLIPDFIPVLGYLDDLIIVPLGIMLVVKMVSEELMADCRAKARDYLRPGANRVVGALIVGIWLIAVLCLTMLLVQWHS